MQVVVLNHLQDETVLSAREEHYCKNYRLNSQIDVLRTGSGMTRADKNFLTAARFYCPLFSVAEK